MSIASRLLGTAFGLGALGVASLLLEAVLLPLLRVLPGRERKEVRAQHTLHWSIRIYLRVLTLLGVPRVRATGAARLHEPGILVVANHPTLIDAPLVKSLMPQADCVVKVRYCDHPSFGGVPRASGYIRAGDGVEVVGTAVKGLVRGRLRSAANRRRFTKDGAGGTDRSVASVWTCTLGKRVKDAMADRTNWCQATRVPTQSVHDVSRGASLVDS